MIRVLVVDDHRIVRDGLQVLLGALDGITVEGTASDGLEAVRAVAELHPDVVVMDVSMPGTSGVEATRRITVEHPEVRVLMLTMNEDLETIRSALRAGARGYLLKGALKAEVLRAIRGAHNGEAIFGPAIAQRLMQFFATARPHLPSLAFPELTEREREILGLMAQRLTNQEIAERLVLSSKTVRNHVSNIFTKLQVADRTQAILRARDAGLG